MLRVVASVPPVTFPKTPKPLPLCFHRVKLSLLNNKNCLESFDARNTRQSIAFFAFVHFFVLPGLRFNSAVLLVFLRQDESTCFSYLG
jgi:hypothetical protein